MMFACSASTTPCVSYYKHPSHYTASVLPIASNTVSSLCDSLRTELVTSVDKGCGFPPYFLASLNCLPRRLRGLETVPRVDVLAATTACQLLLALSSVGPAGSPQVDMLSRYKIKIYGLLGYLKWQRSYDNSSLHDLPRLRQVTRCFAAQLRLAAFYPSLSLPSSLTHFSITSCLSSFLLRSLRLHTIAALVAGCTWLVHHHPTKQSLQATPSLSLPSNNYSHSVQ